MPTVFALLDAAHELVRARRLHGASVEYRRGPRGEHVVAIVFGDSATDSTT